MTTFILAIALLCFIRKCRQLAAELNTAYAAIATLQDDAMYERCLARVRAEPVEPIHYETPFDGMIAEHERCARAHQVLKAFETGVTDL